MSVAIQGAVTKIMALDWDPFLVLEPEHWEALEDAVREVLHELVDKRG